MKHLYVNDDVHAALKLIAAREQILLADLTDKILRAYVEGEI